MHLRLVDRRERGRVHAPQRAVVEGRELRLVLHDDRVGSWERGRRGERGKRGGKGGGDEESD